MRSSNAPTDGSEANAAGEALADDEYEDSPEAVCPFCESVDPDVVDQLQGVSNREYVIA